MGVSGGFYSRLGSVKDFLEAEYIDCCRLMGNELQERLVNATAPNVKAK